MNAVYSVGLGPSNILLPLDAVQEVAKTRGGRTTLLFNVQPTDPAVYGAVSMGLVAVALVASYLPARRASRIDP